MEALRLVLMGGPLSGVHEVCHMIAEHFGVVLVFEEARMGSQDVAHAMQAKLGQEDTATSWLLEGAPLQAPIRSLSCCAASRLASG